MSERVPAYLSCADAIITKTTTKNDILLSPCRAIRFRLIFWPVLPIHTTQHTADEQPRPVSLAEEANSTVNQSPVLYANHVYSRNRGLANRQHRTATRNSTKNKSITSVSFVVPYDRVRTSPPYKTPQKLRTPVARTPLWDFYFSFGVASRLDCVTTTRHIYTQKKKYHQSPY